MLVRVDDPAVLGDLCDHLSRLGWVAIEASDNSANILAAGDDFQAAIELLAALAAWAADREHLNLKIEL
jgi:hypothetical protein